MRAVDWWMKVLRTCCPLPTIVRQRPAVFLPILLLASPVHAAIFFGMSLEGDTLTLTNQGDSTVFYPAVLRLLHDGRWEALAPPAGVVHAAELLPGASLELDWPASSPQQQEFPLEMLRPTMVRFFDSAGSGFGQISFFTPPPSATNLVEVSYDAGVLTLWLPAGEGNAAIRASWLLWPREDGIAPLTAPIAFEHRQPAAQRIEWRAGMAPLRIDPGAGMPAVILLHETGNGFTLQLVPDGGLQGRQQRTAWLSAQDVFYNLAAGAGLAAGLLLLWQLAGALRARKLA